MILSEWPSRFGDEGYYRPFYKIEIPSPREPPDVEFDERPLDPLRFDNVHITATEYHELVPKVVSRDGLLEAAADIASIINRSCADLAFAGAEILPKTGTVAGPAEVCEGVFVGSRDDAAKATLKAHGITAVLHLVEHPDFEPEAHVLHKTICLRDARGYRADAGGEIDSALDFIDACRHARTPVLVHCDEGVNRAGAVAVAYLMDPGKGFGLTLGQAVRQVSSRRGRILASGNFVGALLRLAGEWDQLLTRTWFGEAGRETDADVIMRDRRQDDEGRTAARRAHLDSFHEELAVGRRHTMIRVARSIPDFKPDRTLSP